MLVVSTFDTPVGCLEIAYDEQGVHRAIFVKHRRVEKTTHPMYKDIETELGYYFNDPMHTFKVRLNVQGTPYQYRVWKALLDIPVGETRTYGEFAKHLCSSPRAVGQACKRNAIVLFVPCHRIVGQHDLGGYMGATDALRYKKALLEHERK